MTPRVISLPPSDSPRIHAGEAIWFGYQHVGRLREMAGAPVLDGPPLCRG